MSKERTISHIAMLKHLEESGYDLYTTDLEYAEDERDIDTYTAIEIAERLGAEYKNGMYEWVLPEDFDLKQ